MHRVKKLDICLYLGFKAHLIWLLNGFLNKKFTLDLEQIKIFKISGFDQKNILSKMHFFNFKTRPHTYLKAVQRQVFRVSNETAI